MIIDARSAIDSVLESEARAEQMEEYSKNVRARAVELRKTMRCFCDLDRWEPEPISGHSWVCPIHKAATGAVCP